MNKDLREFRHLIGLLPSRPSLFPDRCLPRNQSPASINGTGANHLALFRTEEPDLRFGGNCPLRSVGGGSYNFDHLLWRQFEPVHNSVSIIHGASPFAPAAFTAKEEGDFRCRVSGEAVGCPIRATEEEAPRMDAFLTPSELLSVETSYIPPEPNDVLNTKS